MKLVDSSADQWVVMLLVAMLEETLVYKYTVDSSADQWVAKLVDSSADQWVAKLVYSSDQKLEKTLVCQ